MKEHELAPSPGAHRERKRIGRGIAAGQGKTAGKGTKGQKARTGGQIARWFQGGQNPIHKKLPYKRGFTNLFRTEYNVVNVGQLERFEAGSEVTIEVIFASRLARRKTWPVKILGEGELSRPLTVQAHTCSEAARTKIEAAGGRVLLLDRAAAGDEATQAAETTAEA
jgi:large subunit ribosomal protein L15